MRPISFSDEQDIYQNKFLSLNSVNADFGEFECEYFVVDKGRRSGGIILRNDKVLLVRQHRFLIDDMSWELPGGGVAADENWEQAAIGECKEEAGIICHSLTPVIQYHQGIDTTPSPAYIFEYVDFTKSTDFEN
ncbi:NUDIX hydrolase [SAR202 cluster bacterium AD-812-D07_MRT_10900m]|nr:NUDIX hydrolase [SAR202 cluster bacterium AD-812-D07_MRT_10900m]